MIMVVKIFHIKVIINFILLVLSKYMLNTQSARIITFYPTIVRSFNAPLQTNTPQARVGFYPSIMFVC